MGTQFKIFLCKLPSYFFVQTKIFFSLNHKPFWQSIFRYKIFIQTSQSGLKVVASDLFKDLKRVDGKMMLQWLIKNFVEYYYKKNFVEHYYKKLCRIWLRQTNIYQISLLKNMSIAIKLYEKQCKMGSMINNHLSLRRKSFFLVSFKGLKIWHIWYLH